MRSGFALGATAAAALVLVACRPGATGQPSPGPSVLAAASHGGTAAPSVPGQTDTTWGRIWDGVPSSFPVAPGAVIATDPGDGAASAHLALDSPDARGIASFYRDALVVRGFDALVDGPLEDGSLTVSADDGYGCRVQVTVTPAGSTNLIAVLYGTGCPA
jgi:hypothetical protein